MYIVTTKTLLETFIHENGEIACERAHRVVTVKTHHTGDFTDDAMIRVHNGIIEAIRANARDADNRQSAMKSRL